MKETRGTEKGIGVLRRRACFSRHSVTTIEISLGEYDQLRAFEAKLKEIAYGIFPEKRSPGR